MGSSPSIFGTNSELRAAAVTLSHGGALHRYLSRYNSSWTRLLRRSATPAWPFGSTEGSFQICGGSIEQLTTLFRLASRTRLKFIPLMLHVYAVACSARASLGFAAEGWCRRRILVAGRRSPSPFHCFLKQKMSSVERGCRRRTERQRYRQRRLPQTAPRGRPLMAASRMYIRSRRT